MFETSNTNRIQLKVEASPLSLRSTSSHYRESGSASIDPVASGNV
jgi:hypothetical protein